jgi:hypothetical protein
MSQEIAQPELKDQSQQLMDGPLKHIRAAALAAALVPLASVFAAPAAAQGSFCSGSCPPPATISGNVFNDTNGNGFQDAGEAGLPETVQILCTGCPPEDTITVFTDSNGNYVSPPLDSSQTYTVAILIPVGNDASPVTPGGNVGSSNGYGYSTVSGVSAGTTSISFGFTPSSASNPGTGTPGYWKNHPDAWPVTSIVVGGVTYTKAQAIAWLGNVSKDRTTAMFASLVPAMLNAIIGNDVSCVNVAIADANAWLEAPPIGYGPVGSGVSGGSAAWQIGDPIHNTLDAYNNGQLCAPHRK